MIYCSLKRKRSGCRQRIIIQLSLTAVDVSVSVLGHIDRHAALNVWKAGRLDAENL